jgi:integrase
MANLAALSLKEDVSREAKGRKVYFVVHIFPQKTKGRQAIDAIIEPPLSTVIEHYLKHYRHLFVDQPADWVFPRRSGGARSPSHLGKTIAKKIFDETGIVMNPHLFRHLSGALFLEAHPGEYESVRRLVAHAKIETTTSFYAPQSSRAAHERYARILQRYRQDT